MKVKALITALSALPSEAEVTHLWDGEARTRIEMVWLARGGFVVTSDHGEVCYSDETRPATAPTSQQDRYWQTPAKKTSDDYES